MESNIIPVERIDQSIIVLRGKKVMLDSVLAELYGVETKNLVRAVKRNLDRFPADFMFQLTEDEFENLRFHFGTSSWGGRRYLPYVFTEHGAVMLASVLNSPVAINASVQVVRAFVKLRQILATHAELARKLTALEKKYDTQFASVFQAIRQLMETDKKPVKKIGFKPEGKSL
jgi:phage regulator Rha-like protein